ncbi:MAG: flagellar hook-basal body protein [Oscillospiraceae bacterium]
MSIAFHTGVSGMNAFQEKLNITGNNLANANTVGYKKQGAKFQDLLYTRMNLRTNYPGKAAGEGEDAGAVGGENIKMVGHGVKMGATEVLYGQGGYVATDMPLDFAIQGDGLFAVDNDGKREYTRNGAFHISMDGKSAYLTTADGANVLDSKGRAIKLQMDKDGLPDITGLIDKLGVYHFPNPFGLSPASGSRFTQTGVSGEATAQKQGHIRSTVIQYALENSSVNMADEMVNMIEAQRAFQLNARVVQTADQIDEMVNNLR